MLLLAHADEFFFDFFIHVVERVAMCTFYDADMRRVTRSRGWTHEMTTLFLCKGGISRQLDRRSDFSMGKRNGG